MKTLLTFVFGLFLFIGAVTNISAQGAGLSSQHWALSEINGDSVSGSKAFIEFSSDRLNVSGNAGCNRFFGGVRVGRGTVRFSGLGSTRMFCDGAMDAEAAFLEALKDVTRYRLRGNVLTLFAGRTAILKFEGTPLPEDQSGDGSSMSVSVSITDRKWILDAITGESVSLPENPAFIVFDGEQKRAGGNSACNNFGGSYTARDGKFSLSRPVSTMRACIEDGRSKVERGFLDALQKADRYYISGDKLTLYSGDVAILEFTGVAKDS